jgi:RecB family endonuclease NucS
MGIYLNPRNDNNFDEYTILNAGKLSEYTGFTTEEVRLEWHRAVSVTSDYSVTDSIISSSKELLEETINCNESAVAKALDESHIHVTSNRSYNNEDALQSAIYLSYIYALNKYTIVREMTAGKGFADVVFIPFVENMPAMIIELKRNDCAESAIKQIKEKRYFDSLASYSGNLLFVGINYDEKTKKHECKIEKLEV